MKNCHFIAAAFQGMVTLMVTRNGDTLFSDVVLIVTQPLGDSTPKSHPQGLLPRVTS